MAILTTHTQRPLCYSTNALKSRGCFFRRPVTLAESLLAEKPAPAQPEPDPDGQDDNQDPDPAITLKPRVDD